MEQLDKINFDYNIEFLDFGLKILLTIILAIISSYSFRKYSTGLNRSTNLISNSILLGLVVCVIIAVVKSSLALSLGLVGALSIVRFRNAVKDPNELLLYFSSIAIGIAIGANQYVAAGMFSLAVFIFNIVNYTFKIKNIADTSSVLLLKSEKDIDYNLIVVEMKKVLKREFKLISMTHSDGCNEICFEIYDLSEGELKLISNLRENFKGINVELIPSIF